MVQKQQQQQLCVLRKLSAEPGLHQMRPVLTKAFLFVTLLFALT